MNMLLMTEIKTFVDHTVQNVDPKCYKVIKSYPKTPNSTLPRKYGWFGKNIKSKIDQNLKDSFCLAKISIKHEGYKWINFRANNTVNNLKRQRSSEVPKLEALLKKAN